MDLAKPGAGADLVARVDELGVDVAYLVNNAGVGILGLTVQDSDPDAVSRQPRLYRSTCGWYRSTCDGDCAPTDDNRRSTVRRRTVAMSPAVDGGRYRHVPRYEVKTVSDEQAIRDVFTGLGRGDSDAEPRRRCGQPRSEYRDVRRAAAVQRHPRNRRLPRRVAAVLRVHRQEGRSSRFSSSTSWPEPTWRSRTRCCAAAHQQMFEENPDNRLRVTVGLRKVDGRWVIAHEHHSFPMVDTAS